MSRHECAGVAMGRAVAVGRAVALGCETVHIGCGVQRTVAQNLHSPETELDDHEYEHAKCGCSDEGAFPTPPRSEAKNTRNCSLSQCRAGQGSHRQRDKCANG